MMGIYNTCGDIVNRNGKTVHLNGFADTIHKSLFYGKDLFKKILTTAWLFINLLRMDVRVVYGDGLENR